jgi:parallel beta-helix repeat protein
VVENNNTQRFKEQPVSGGIKVAQSKGVRLSGNLIRGNTTTGLWFDMSSQNVVIDRNQIRDNGGKGIEFEASDSALIVSNILTGNDKAAVQVFDSSRVDIWNNTITGGPTFAVRVLQDARRSGDPAIPFITSAVRLRNNVIQLGTGACPLLVDDLQDLRTAAQMGVTSDGNLYHRAGPTSPSNVACLAAGSKGFVTYKTLTALRLGNRTDAWSRLVEGAPVASPSGVLSAAAVSPVTGVAVPSNVAGYLGAATGWRGVGAR